MTLATSTPTVRPLSPGDAPALIRLISAFADYEHLPGPDPDAASRLVADALAEPPRFRTLVVEVDGEAVGYAVYFFTYSTFLARPTLFLEDIFVLPTAQGRGVGRAVFQWLASEATANGCGRFEWQVLTWNEPAIGFYDHIGGKRMDSWYSYRLDEAGIARLAGG
jgi:GNAT superfamily N-acetyltransferase